MCPLVASVCSLLNGSLQTGETNKHRYVLVSQSQPLRSKLRNIPAVPMVHINRSVMILEPPSDATIRAKNAVSVWLFLFHTSCSFQCRLSNNHSNLLRPSLHILRQLPKLRRRRHRRNEKDRKVPTRLVSKRKRRIRPPPLRTSPNAQAPYMYRKKWVKRGSELTIQYSTGTMRGKVRLP